MRFSVLIEQCEIFGFSSDFEHIVIVRFSPSLAKFGNLSRVGETNSLLMQEGYKTLEKWFMELNGKTARIRGPFLELSEPKHSTCLIVEFKGKSTTIKARKTTYIWHVNLLCLVKCAGGTYSFLTETWLLVPPGTKFTVTKTTVYEQIKARR